MLFDAANEILDATQMAQLLLKSVPSWWWATTTQTAKQTIATHSIALRCRIMYDPSFS
jgi:hypothetical protein